MIKNLTTLILPCWIPKGSGKEKYITWCLNSLVEKTDSNFELIAIDNESTKASKAFLKSFKQKIASNKFCQSFRIISFKENIGFTGGWDVGIEKSKGDNICILNDDIVFEYGWLKKMLKHLRDDIVAVGPNSNFVSGLQDIKNSHKDAYEEKVNYLIGFCLLIKKKALDDIYEQDEKGGHYIDPRFYPGGSEELDVCIRLAKKGYDMVIARDVFIHHFGSRSLSLFKEFTNPPKFFQKRLNMLIKKHGKDYVGILDQFQHSPKFSIGIPSIGQVDALFLSNFPWMLQSAWNRFGFNNLLTIISPRNLPHLGRNEILKKAIQYGSENILFIDDDQIIDANIVERLYSHNKDFVTAVAYRRIEPYTPCIYKGKDEEGKFIPYLKHHQGLVEVDASGLPCTMIKMSAIKKLLRKKYKEIKKRGGLFYFSRFGEDLNFCEDLRSIGVKLYADTDAVVGHLGAKKIIDNKTFDAYQNLLEKSKLN